MKRDFPENKKNMLLLSFHRFVKVLFLSCLLSCNAHRELHDDTLRIKIPENEVRTQLYASDVISEIEYVALETLPQCLIGERAVFSAHQ